MTPDQIRQRLRALDPEPRFRLTEFAGLRDLFSDLSEAAVLIPLTERDGAMEVVLTQRSLALRKHSGEVSFPGGRRDPEDESLVRTALRESHEEIALFPDDVDVYGALMRMPTVTGYEVTVYVGEFSQPYELDPNPHEIETLIQGPLTDFLDDSIHRKEERLWNGHKVPIHYFDWRGHNVWGATAFMLVTLMDYLGARR